jgi:hypothetical protein
MSKTTEFIILGTVVFVAALAANLVALKVAADVAEVKLNEAKPAGGILGLLAKIAS